MRKVLIWIGVGVVATLLGVGAAAGTVALIRNLATRYAIRLDAELPQLPERPILPEWVWGDSPWGEEQVPHGPMMGRPGWRDSLRRGPMMEPGWQNKPSPSGERLSLDRAVEIAQDYAAENGTGLEVSEVMEFSDNFYAAIVEAGTGRGAFEILIDPYVGDVSPEPGPNMMWNNKYGHMGRGGQVDHQVSQEEARRLAQGALDNELSGAQLSEEGIEFYGYYTFDYMVDGKPAGMLSINALSGRVWFHTWHGTFIAEKEMEE